MLPFGGRPRAVRAASAPAPAPAAGPPGPRQPCAQCPSAAAAARGPAGTRACRAMLVVSHLLACLTVKACFDNCSTLSNQHIGNSWPLESCHGAWQRRLFEHSRLTQRACSAPLSASLCCQELHQLELGLTCWGVVYRLVLVLVEPSLQLLSHTPAPMALAEPHFGKTEVGRREALRARTQHRKIRRVDRHRCRQRGH